MTPLQPRRNRINGSGLTGNFASLAMRASNSSANLATASMSQRWKSRDSGVEATPPFALSTNAAGAEPGSGFGSTETIEWAARRSASPWMGGVSSTADGHAPRREGALGLARVNAHHAAMKGNDRLRRVSIK